MKWVFYKVRRWKGTYLFFKSFPSFHLFKAVKIVSNGIPFKKWVHSTYIDISSYSGTAFIAFKYSGTGNTNFDGTYELDQILIHAKK